MFDKTTIRALGIACGAVVQVLAQSVNLTGTVFNSKGIPIEGVSVKLIAIDICDTTNSSGDYSLVKSGVQNKHQQFISSDARFHFKNGKIELLLRNTQSASIALFDTKGRHIRTIVPKRILQAGTYNFKIGNEKSGNGVYIMRFQCGKKAMFFLYSNFGPSNVTTDFMENSPGSRSSIMNEAQTGGFLLFEKQGYLTCKLPVKAYVGVNNVFLQQKNGIQSPASAEYYLEIDGTQPGKGNDGSNPAIVPKLKASENVDRPSINYSYSVFHGIDSYNFYGVWNGTINIQVPDQIINANFDVSWSHVSFTVDDTLIAQWVNSSKIIPLHLTAGNHTYRIDCHNHWHTTGFNASFTGYPKTDTASAISEMGHYIKNNCKSIYIGGYESGSIHNEVTLTLPETHDSIALFLTSYNAINWLINNPHNTAIVCVGFNAYGPGSTIVGAGEAPIFEIADFTRSYDDVSGPSKDIFNITGKAPVWTYAAYSLDNVDIQY